MELTLEKAKELAIKKWEWIVENKGKSFGVEDSIPELKGLNSECAYCELFADYKDECDGCPLSFKKEGIQVLGCFHKGHPYLKWDLRPTKSNAQKVLDLIKSK